MAIPSLTSSSGSVFVTHPVAGRLSGLRVLSLGDSFLTAISEELPGPSLFNDITTCQPFDLCLPCPLAMTAAHEGAYPTSLPLCFLPLTQCLLEHDQNSSMSMHSTKMLQTTLFYSTVVQPGLYNWTSWASLLSFVKWKECLYSFTVSHEHERRW